MADKELRKMSRTELIEIIYALKQNEDAIEKEKEELQAKLADRTIRIAKAGSIAEASMNLNQVFEAAQAAADDYLRSIMEADEDTNDYAVMIRSEAEGYATSIRAQAEEEAERILAEARSNAETLKAQSEKAAMVCVEQAKKRRSQILSGNEEKSYDFDAEWKNIFGDTAAGTVQTAAEAKPADDGTARTATEAALTRTESETAKAQAEAEARMAQKEAEARKAQTAANTRRAQAYAERVKKQDTANRERISFSKPAEKKTESRDDALDQMLGQYSELSWLLSDAL